MRHIVFILLIIVIIIGAISLNRNSNTSSKEEKIKNKGKVSKERLDKKAVYSRVNRTAPKNAPIREKLDSIIVEHMEFEERTIKGFIDSLSKQAVKADPDGQGVNIVYLPERKLIKYHSDSDEDEFLLEDDVEEEKPEKEEIPERTITMMFDDLSLGEAIRNICIAAELKYRVEKNAVVIAHPSVPLDPMETRIYPIEPECEFHVDKSDDSSTDSVVPYFKRQGVDFPRGADIVYDDGISRLIARNTPENLRRIERIITPLCINDPQVMITARFLKIPEAEYRKLQRAYDNKNDPDYLPVKSALWEKMLLSDKFETIASAVVLTQNGEEATIRMTREVYFPDSWGEPTNLIGPDLNMASIEEMPEFGEATELGLRLTVTPTVAPDKYTITLDSIPVLQYFTGWSKYPGPIRMGIIKAWNTYTQVTVYDGESFRLGSFVEDVYDKTLKKRVRNRFMVLITARLVNPDGSNLRNIYGELNPVETKAIPKNTQNIYPDERKLQKIKLDKINFIDTDLQKAVKNLKATTNLNMVLGMDESDLERVPKINLNLRDIPLNDALRYLCMQTGLQYRMDDKVLLVGNESIQDMDTVSFSVRPALIEIIRPQHDENDGWGDDDIFEEDELFDAEDSLSSRVYTTGDLKKYFEEHLITFPEGTTVSYSRRSQKLTVKNTKKNLGLMKKLLRNLDIGQPQIEIESTIVEISAKDLIKLIGNKAALASNLTQEQIRKIINSPEGIILSKQTLIAKNGEEAYDGLVNETYLPFTYSAPELVIFEGKYQFTPPIPEFSEATGFGSQLTVTPNLSPDNNTISLSLKPQVLKFLGWTEYPISLKLTKWEKNKKSTCENKMGKFSRKDLYSNIKLYDGTTILAGRTQLLDYPNVKENEMHPNISHTEFFKKAKKDGNELKNVFFFIKASIVNPDGKVVK